MALSGPPRFFIKTFGCQMNVDDSSGLARMLRGFGLEEAADAAGADLVHINTCSVRKKAEEKFFSFLGAQKKRKLREGRPVLGVSGCAASLHDLKSGHPELDYVIGARDPREYASGIERVVSEKFPDLPSAPARSFHSAVFAYQTVVRGCSNYCAYCVVPYARGREESIAPDEIARQVKTKIEEGAKEITLLGQNALAYGEDLDPRKSLIDAIRVVHDLPGLARLRFVTSHPRWVKADFLRALAGLPKVCENFHVPFQSGDDAVLGLMNRGYTSGEYRDKIAMIRELVPGASVSADCIVGFPRETGECFENTVKLVRDVRPDQLYAFKYSAREGTRAAAWEDDVPNSEKEARLARLLDLHEQISREINESLKGTSKEVMVAEVVAPRRYRGRTRTNKITDFTAAGELTIGDVVNVAITGATPHALRGECV
jgi:tRNA-2-methylthio-N6-dimethylallyladenosine synthase